MTCSGGIAFQGYNGAIGTAQIRLGSSGGEDCYFNRKAAATIQLGTDANGVTNQMLTAANRITGDGVGANFTIAAGNGRGGAAGNLIFSSWTTAGAATAGTLTTMATIDITKLLIASGKELWLGNAATTGLGAGLLSALTNASIVISDQSGQAYRIPCII